MPKAGTFCSWPVDLKSHTPFWLAHNSPVYHTKTKTKTKKERRGKEFKFFFNHSSPFFVIFIIDFPLFLKVKLSVLETYNSDLWKLNLTCLFGQSQSILASAFFFQFGNSWSFFFINCLSFDSETFWMIWNWPTNLLSFICETKLSSLEKLTFPTQLKSIIILSEKDILKCFNHDFYRIIFGCAWELALCHPYRKFARIC